MGVSWALECKKCKEARTLLFELGHDEVAESIDEAYHFSVDTEIEAVDDLVAWLIKHKEHSTIKFTGYP